MILQTYYKACEHLNKHYKAYVRIILKKKIEKKKKPTYPTCKI